MHVRGKQERGEGGKGMGMGENGERGWLGLGKKEIGERGKGK